LFVDWLRAELDGRHARRMPGIHAFAAKEDVDGRDI
jgi:hypothetical protein